MYLNNTSVSTVTTSRTIGPIGCQSPNSPTTMQKAQLRVRLHSLPTKVTTQNSPHSQTAYPLLPKHTSSLSTSPTFTNACAKTSVLRRNVCKNPQHILEYRHHR